MEHAKGFVKDGCACASIFACLLVVILAACATAADAASQPTHFGEFGTGPGQMRLPIGVATDTSGNIYVSDGENERIDEFDSSGVFLAAWGVGVADGSEKLQTCTDACEAGSSGGIEGFELPTGLAVDSKGDVYVTDYAHVRVEKFGPNHEFLFMVGGKVNVQTGANLCNKEDECRAGIAELGKGAHGEFSFWNAVTNFMAVGGPNEELYVGDTARVQVFNSSGEWLKDLSLEALSTEGQPEALAVDEAGDVFVKDSGVSGVRELEPNGGVRNIQLDEGSNTITGLTLDSAHHLLYVGDSEGGFHVLEYDMSSGQLLKRFGGSTIGTDASFGIANSNTAATAYATDLERSVVWSLPIPGSGPLITSESATPSLHGNATLEAAIDAENAETKYYFQYVSRSEYERSGFAKALSTPRVTIPAAFTEQSAAASLTGLSAGETYHWQVVAESAGGSAVAVGEPFVETPASTIEGPSATQLTSEGVTLSARVVNLQGVDTEYRLEYGLDTSYGNTAVTGSIGPNEGAISFSRHLQGLQAGTTYHYRVVTRNEFGTTESPDHVFTTQFAETGTVLPDARQWELVSPPDKRGALIEDAEGAYDVQAAANGTGVTYVANEPLTSGVTGRPWSFQEIISRRGSQGWSSEEVTVPASLLPETSASALGHQSTLPPPLFSTDLARAVTTPGPLAPLLSSEATERTMYIRNNPACAQASQACYRPLVTSANVPAGTAFGSNETQMQFLGASPDLNHVVFEYPAALTGEAHNYPFNCGGICTPSENLYEWSEGSLQLVNVFGAGAQRVPTPAEDEVFLGGPEHETIAHAVSNDGRRIVWSYKPTSPETIFEVRDMAAEKTIQIGGRGALFQAMSSDGSRVFFLEGGDLRVLEVETGVRVDLTAHHGAGEASARVQDAVIGIGEDGRNVYFVAQGAIAPGAIPGGDNLYEAQYAGGEWKVVLIATLSAEDEKDWFAPVSGTPSLNLGLTSSRVSPNGQFIAFMSNRSLTGYDNTDANSGQPDEEVYLYNASSGQLACVSCDPTGARPVGAFYSGPGPLVDRRGAWEGHWFAAIIPGWERVEGGLSLYQPRFLGNTGRVFFQSSDALVQQDTNGLEDVYEWEPPGVGGCVVASTTFVRSSGGCVNLISSGTSASESAFYDASESGDDAFFVTASRLTPADRDNSFDVYDAHVCSPTAPCFTSFASPPACATTDACRGAPAPQPETFGPPPSATFSGAGNIPASAAASHVVRRKSSTRKQRLRRALRMCRERDKRRPHAREACERRAIKRYAAGKGRKANITGRDS